MDFIQTECDKWASFRYYRPHEGRSCVSGDDRFVYLFTTEIIIVYMRLIKSIVCMYGQISIFLICYNPAFHIVLRWGNPYICVYKWLYYNRSRPHYPPRYLIIFLYYFIYKYTNVDSPSSLADSLKFSQREGGWWWGPVLFIQTAMYTGSRPGQRRTKTRPPYHIWGLLDTVIGIKCQRHVGFCFHFILLK
jgi:hypothetical protein